MNDRVLRWGSTAFVVSIVLLLSFGGIMARVPGSPLERLGLFLGGVCLLSLPIAVVNVWREMDRTRRRWWLLLLGVCIAILAVSVVLYAGQAH